VAIHIADAQASGLPGAYGTNQPLTRLTDPVLRDRNGDTACPRSIPRPPGKQCDEYPFRSTWEGAFTGGGRYSIRILDGDKNGRAGTALQTFYNNDRVIERDPFYVRITP
jgi:hypothetical protein